MTAPTLAERVERADWPDRELDEAIALATNVGATIEYMTKFTMEPDPWLRRLRPNDPNFSKGYSLERLPAYTASIDAALTLVPEGWAWTVRSEGLAVLLSPKGPWDDVGQQADQACATPALAICAAALRAKGQADAE